MISPYKYTFGDKVWYQNRPYWVHRPASLQKRAQWEAYNDCDHQDDDTYGDYFQSVYDDMYGRGYWLISAEEPNGWCGTPTVYYESQFQKDFDGTLPVGPGHPAYDDLISLLFRDRSVYSNISVQDFPYHLRQDGVFRAAINTLQDKTNASWNDYRKDVHAGLQNLIHVAKTESRVPGHEMYNFYDICTRRKVVVDKVSCVWCDTIMPYWGLCEDCTYTFGVDKS